MSDVFQQDPDRILINTLIGGVQAWGTRGDSDVAVSASFYCTPQNGGSGHSAYSQFMTVAEARSLGEALLKAADHAVALIDRALAGKEP